MGPQSIEQVSVYRDVIGHGVACAPAVGGDENGRIGTRSARHPGVRRECLCDGIEGGADGNVAAEYAIGSLSASVADTVNPDGGWSRDDAFRRRRIQGLERNWKCRGYLT